MEIRGTNTASAIGETQNSYGKTIQLLDTVALLQDLPQKGLGRGQVGTVVEQLGPDAFEVEFVGVDGETYALLPLRAEQIMVLRYAPAYAV